MSNSNARQRPDDIVSPVADSSLADSQKAGRVGHDKPTSDNSVVLLINHQIGLTAGVCDFNSLAEYKSNFVGFACVAKALKIQVLISSSNVQWQNDDTLPESKEIFSDQPIYRRTGIINSYEDPSFCKTFDALATITGRRHIITAGVTIGTSPLNTSTLISDYETSKR